ncbi:MAG: N-acetylneuraminate synthase [Candidatus Riflebacteria bacterium]|nr:N-acetylneuraminate synthase [Candidatus Riflebacteria bacterium]
MKIGQREIGHEQSCFIIAEAGSNHNRDFENAKKLIDVAVEAGADAVKFQIFSAEAIYSKKTPMASYLKDKKLVKDGESLWDIIKRIEIPRQWTPDLMAYCQQKGIIFLSTPFDLNAVDELEAAGVEAYKVASFEITHLPMLKKISATGKPIILSTGMASLEDIEIALAAIRSGGSSEVALLHCAIAYPPKFEDINLRAMDTMRQAFGLPVGFSDHTMGHVTDVAAVARGACIIEKHFTLSRQQEGPDHPFSLEPGELKAMVEAIRQTEKLLGSPLKQHTAAENELYRIARRSLVAAVNIPSGTVITEDMLAVKRPGFGIPVRHMELVIGRTARRDIEEDDILTWEMI